MKLYYFLRHNKICNLYMRNEVATVPIDVYIYREMSCSKKTPTMENCQKARLSRTHRKFLKETFIK